MKGFGETLRKIRVQKGYTIKQLADRTLSVSFLSKFERGQSDISLSYFTDILEKLSLSFEEFFYIHNNYNPDQVEDFFQQAYQAYLHRDLAKLRHLKKIELEKWNTYNMETFRCNTFVIEVYEKIISNTVIDDIKKDLHILYEYLFKVEIWGYYELRLYNSTMLLMPPDMVITFSKTAYEKSSRFRQLKKIDNIVVSILLSTLIYLTGGPNPPQYAEEYKVFISYLDKLNIPENELLARNSLLQIKGIYEINRGNEEKGTEMVNKAIEILATLGASGLAKEAENYLEIILSNAKDA